MRRAVVMVWVVLALAGGRAGAVLSPLGRWPSGPLGLSVKA